MVAEIVQFGSHGRIRGKRGSNGVGWYLGIPYALPPTGERRWRKPEALPSDYSYEVSGEPRDCTEFGNICPQEIYMLGGKPFNLVPEAKYSEDCLIVNIWTPAGPPPPAGWPVLAFIHGGWLQIGNPSVSEQYAPHELIAADGANIQAVVVSIGYRLNIFGFLAGDGVEGNFGFWDQRLALEWIQSNIAHVGGDSSRVTLMGHSAGAYSAHTQLQYELLHTDGSRPLFKNVFLCSNAIPAQPKTREEANSQLQDLSGVFKIPKDLSGDEKLQALRKISANALVEALPRLCMSNFRAVTDGAMIHADMMRQFEDGTFATRFRDRGYRLLTGETETEQYLYSQWLPPKNEEDLPIKLQNYYPAAVVDKLIGHPGFRGSVVEVFSHIVSDLQVRAPIRLLCRQLLDAGVPPDRVQRYRVAFRPGFFDEFYPPEAGVTHGADLYIWWAGKRFGYSEGEWDALKRWLNDTFARLVNNEPLTHQTGGRTYLHLGPQGESQVVDDQYWDHLMSVVETVATA